ncbi:MAG: hypothetical protein QXQ11_08870 [Candidatus Bathyarchaeia archaeon]
MENFENRKIIEDFNDHLKIDRRLEEGTVERHLLEIRRLLENANFNVLKVTKLDIRNSEKIH